MDPETLTLISNAIAGPASGVAVSLICLGAFLWFLVKHLLPQQERSLGKILESHADDRKSFEKSIVTMSKRIDRVEDSIEEVAKNVSFIKDRM